MSTLFMKVRKLWFRKDIRTVKDIFFKPPNDWKWQKIRFVRESKVVYDYQQNELNEGNFMQHIER